MRRDKIAVPICLASAMAGAVLIHRGYPPFHVLFALSMIWAALGQWLNTHRFKHLGLKVTDIADAAKSGTLYSSSLARAISHGSVFIGMAGIVCWFNR